MANSKNLSVNGRYEVNAIDIGLSAETIRINGNLIVEGTRTEVNSIDSYVFDNIVVLNKGETGAGVTGRLNSDTGTISRTAGLEVDRGSLDTATLRWNEDSLRWEIGVGNSVNSILTLGDTGSFLTKVEDDISPKLGGNLNVSNKQITSDASTNIKISPAAGHNVELSSPLVVKDSVIQNTSTASTAIYAGASTGGGTGLYTSRNGVSDELISKRKAIAFSIIF